MSTTDIEALRRVKAEADELRTEDDDTDYARPVVALRGHHWEYRSTTGSAFRLYRECLQMTRDELAAEVGVSASHLGAIERDERRCHEDSALYGRLVHFFAMPPAWVRDRMRASA